jgi:hypothetical protein
MSALKKYSQLIESLHGQESLVSIEFNFSVLPLPKEEKNSKVKNLIFMIAGEEIPDFDATVCSTNSTKEVAIKFEKNLASSTSPPLESEHASPLNYFVEQDANQSFILNVDKEINPDVDFRKVKDIILGIEYEAEYKQ